MHLPQLVVALSAMRPDFLLRADRPAAPGNPVTSVPQTEGSFLPPAIVLWHGLGDRYNSDGMAHVAGLVARLLPDSYVHSIYVDETPALDERRSLFGDANRAVDLVCAQLSNITELSRGFGAIGFSQGGLFLRALIQRCPSIAVSKLVTFGSPHMGVLELPVCHPPDDWVCRKRNQLLKAQVWQDSVQKTVVPAQYFRDPGQYERYLEHSNFLAAVNNERPSEGSRAAKRRFERLQKLVLIKFAQDSTLVPQESAFFQERHGLTGQEVPMTGTRVYRDNLFGLRTLHEAGRIEFHTVDDEHMRFSDDFFLKIVSDHFAGEPAGPPLHAGRPSLTAMVDARPAGARPRAS